MAIIIAWGFIFYDAFSGHKFPGAERDGGILYYTIIRHIQKLQDGDFGDWVNMKIFLPNWNTLAYTEHLYLHSLIGAPYYVFTKNPFGVLDFIFFVQVIIGAGGYYLLVSRFTNTLLIKIVTGLFFIYNPVFIYLHPQINFYSFIPWIVFFFIKLLKTKKIWYIYALFLALLLQMLVGVYVQIFVVFFFSVSFFLFYVLYKKDYSFGFLFSKKFIPHMIINSLIIGIVLAFVNYPYYEFKKLENAVRSIAVTNRYSADLMVSFFIPAERWSGDVYSNIDIFKDIHDRFNVAPANIFVGIVPLTLLGISLVVLLLKIIDKKFICLKMPTKPLILIVILSIVIGVFMLGPNLKILGEVTNIKLPYYLLYKGAFIFQAIRVTPRAVVALALPLSILLVFWLNELQKRTISGGVKVFVMGVLLLLTFTDIFKVSENKYDRQEILDNMYIYDIVEEQPGEVLLELPSGLSCKNLGANDTKLDKCWIPSDGYYMFTHIYHDKWTLNGYSGYVPENSERFFDEIDENYNKPEVLYKSISKIPVDLILIHKYRIEEDQNQAFEEFGASLGSFMNVVFEDSNFILLSFNDYE